MVLPFPFPRKGEEGTCEVRAIWLAVRVTLAVLLMILEGLVALITG